MFAALAVAIALAITGACEPERDGLAVSGAVYRAPLSASDVGVAYVTLRSQRDDRIIGVSSDRAATIEMHQTITDDGRSRMSRVDAIDLPAGEDVVFTAGGLHLMVISPRTAAASDGAAQDGEASATFPIQFQLESGATQIVRFKAGTGAAHHE
jgi:copper(I)-binding protein